MSLIIHGKTTKYTRSLIVFSILLIALIASISILNIPPAFSQEQGVDEENDGTLVLSGRINSMLTPIMTDTNNAAINNSSVMSQIIDNGSMTAANATSAASQAMQFSMARDVAWLLSGDWVLSTGYNDSNATTTFDAEFIKVTTNGTMLHTHRITNFVPLTNTGNNIARAFDSNTTNDAIIRGKADVYFNDQLVWPQADTMLSIMNGTVLMINIDSQDVDNHFHNQPIYGTVGMFSRDNGFTMTLPAPKSIEEKIEQELAELGVNATQAQSTIGAQATQTGRTFAEEATDLFNNVTDSVRQFFE
jgi:hypothetical protein